MLHCYSVALCITGAPNSVTKQAPKHTLCSGPGEWLHCTPEPEQRCDGHRLALDRGRVNQWTCLHVATWRDYLYTRFWSKS
jgi:hypothetical protein